MSIEVNRQYIGARYVPKFFENPNTSDSTWLEGVGYEPLTIVTYAGNSFTSKKPVPAGVGSPNLNHEYWVNTGNYNAQVEQCRQLAEQTAARVDTIDDEVEECRQLADQTVTRVDNIEEKVFDENILLISDSYGESPSEELSWFHFFLEAANNGNHGTITEQHRAWSGGGFAVNGSNQFLTALQQFTVAEPEKVNKIIVCGGINDVEAGGYSNIPAGIDAFCNYARTTFPNAQVYIGFIGYAHFAGQYTPNTNLNTYLFTRYLYTANALKNGAFALSDVWQVMHNYHFFNSNDFMHPVEEGSKQLGGAIYNNIYNGGYTINYTTTPRFTPAPNITVNGSSTEIDAGLAYISGENGGYLIPDLAFVSLEGVNIGNSWTDLGNFNTTVFYGNDGIYFEQDAQAIFDGNTPYKNCPMAYRIYRGKLQAKSLQINSTAYETHRYTTLLIKSETILFQTANN